jgi:hypothetical protein
MQNNRIYIAGRITGDDDYKAKFKSAEAQVTEARRWCGNAFHNQCRSCIFYDRDRCTTCQISDVFPQQLEVVNPVDFDLEGRPYWIAMIKCLWKLSRCKYVYFLRDWRYSRGAQIEHRWAKRLHKQIIYQQ